MENSIIQKYFEEVLEKAKSTDESVSSMARKINVSQQWLQVLLTKGWKSPGIDKLIKLELYLLHGITAADVDSSSDKGSA